jgi:uncharacterized membrane protein
MNTILKVVELLQWYDWAALAWYFIAWAGYAHFAKRRAQYKPSILAATNRIRRQWMLQTTRRDVRMVDAVVVQSLSASPSFFASTTILIIGGLLAVLGTSDKATELVRELPFAARTTTLVFEMKLLLLTGVFVYTFFRFTWSLRQYTFGALLIASAPEPKVYDAQGEAVREAFADRAGRVVGLAAETFNDGLRGYYMAFAAAAWFLSPLVFALATAGVVWVLYEREFRSEVLIALRGN